jgi:hypothetical protein
MVSFIIILNRKCYSLKVLSNRTRGLLNKEKFLFWIATKPLSGQLFLSHFSLHSSPPFHLLSFVLLNAPLFLFVVFHVRSMFPFCGIGLWVSLLWDKDWVSKLVIALPYTCSRELMKSVGGYVVIDKSPSYMLLLMVPEKVRDYHFCSYHQFYVLVVFYLPWCVFFFLILQSLSGSFSLT